MFIKKNLAILFVLAILITTMAACGSATPSEPAAEASRNEDVSAESPTQSESEESDPATQPSSETDTPASTDAAYVSADNFWQGDDYFDLEEYLWQNGATSIVKGGLNADLMDFEERDYDIEIYKVDFSNPYWIVTIQEGGVEFRHDGYILDGNPVRRPVHFATPSVVLSESGYVRINDSGSEMSVATIQMLDKMISLMKEYPDEDDPLKHNNETGIFTYSSSSTEIPAGVTKR